MGFAELTCAVCEGKKYVLVPYDHPFNRAIHLQTCANCNGEGTISIHTGSVGSNIISLTLPDECWQYLIDHGSATYIIKQSKDGQVHTEKVDILYKKDDPKSKV